MEGMGLKVRGKLRVLLLIKKEGETPVI